MSHGALQKLKPLLNYESILPELEVIGVLALIRHLRGEISFECAVILAKNAIRHYIKLEFT
jgi:hypothetical protein